MSDGGTHFTHRIPASRPVCICRPNAWNPTCPAHPPTVLASLEGVGGCGALTTMAQAIAETYARDPGFYGATYCVGCRTHLPVGPDGEFYWDGTDEKVGT